MPPGRFANAAWLLLSSLAHDLARWIARLGLDVRGPIVAQTIRRRYHPARPHDPQRPLLSLIADKGLWGRAYAETLRLQGTAIRTPDRVRTADNVEREKGLARLRLVVESTIANLKCQMRLERHLAKTPAGLAQLIAQRLFALTLGMLLNALLGRPPRSLVAYNGR
jgi:DDE family transposase